MSAPTILITRPAEDAEKLATLLQAKGFSTFTEPMLTIRATQEALSLLQEATADPPQALIVSSRHALPLIIHCPKLTEVPIYAVGHETADTARRIGFSDVRHAPTVRDVVTLAMRRCSTGFGRILYLRGREVSEDIATLLRRQGFTAEQHVVYEAEAAKAFSPALISALNEGECDAATFLSTRTAQVFMELAAKARVVHTLASIGGLAISENVAAAMGNAWRSLHVAQEPTLAAVVEAVDKYTRAA